jgi:hypothetical protein
MLHHPMTSAPQQRLLHLSLQLQQSALPMAQAYNARQAALGLEQVMTAERLSSLDGIAASLATIAALERLVEEHKDAVQAWLLAATRQLARALEDLPPGERDAQARPLMASLQHQLDHLQRGLEARATWIVAARTIFDLARRGREREPDAPGPVFASEDDLLEAQRQGKRLDAAAAVQHALLEESLERIRAGMGQMRPH